MKSSMLFKQGFAIKTTLFGNLKITLKNSRFYYLLSTSVILMLVFVLPNKGSSQSCANYAPVTRTTSITYTSIAGSSPNYFTWRNSTSNQNDDNRAFPVSIGFDFWYLGVRYTQFSSNLNGFIDFSTSTSDGNNQSEYGPGYGNQFTIGGVGTGSLLTLAPMYDDLWTAAGGTTAISTSCFYNTTGTAPNRVTTIEWLNFDEFNSATGSLNFQIKLYETSGVIQFIYGTMTQGSIAASYATGINNTWPTGAPNATQLLTQQTVNTTTFSNTAQNALVTLPASNSMLSFTPPTPNAAPTGLSFSAITGSSMMLNWTNTTTNEIGYVIYNSIDGGTTYNFVSQTAANAVSSNVTGLSPSTTYDWKIIAVTDGGISAGLTGTQATAASNSITSIASSSWSNPSTWDCSCVPSSGDIVTIANSHIVTLDVTGSCFDLTIGGGTSGQLIVGNNATGRSLTVNGNLVVNAGATFTTGATNATHTLTLKKDFTNNGTVQLAPRALRICNVTFNRDGNQTLSGTGATTNLNLVTINLGTSTSNIFEVTATNFTAATNFLTLTNGTFKVSTAATLTLASTNTTISSNARIWSNHATAVLNYNTGNVILLGSLRSTLGTINIGSASNNLLAINGGSVVVDGGTINVASSLDNQGISALVSVTISSGTLLVNRFGLTTAGLAPFGLDEIGSTFNMSGGSIIIQNPGAGNLGYTNTGATFGTISGGTIQIGNASTTASQTFLINSSITIPNLTIGGGVATTAQLATNNMPVLGDLLINTGSTFNLSTFTANRSSAGGTLTVAGSMLLGNNTGGQTGSNFPTNYSSLVLTGGTVNYNRAAGGQTIFATPTYTTLTMGNTSGTQTVGGNITTTTLNNNTANIILDMATFTLAATTITNNATATIRTQNTSATPIPTGIPIGGTVNYDATTGGQTIRPNTYTNLTMGNTSGTQTATANLASTGTFTTTAGGTLNMGAFILTVATVAHAGVLNTQNTSTTPVTTGKTWGGTVNYNTAAGGQTVMSGTYGILTMGNTSGTQTASGNIIATTVNNNTNAADILNMVTFTLAATTVNNTGTIRTQNVSGTPLQASITYGGTVQYDGVAQTVVNASYNNVNLAGSLAKTLNAGMTSIAGNLTMSGTATATLVANMSIAGDLTIGTGTSLTFSTFTANRLSAGGTLTVAGSMLLGNNTGGQTGSNFPTNYSSLVLTGGTVNYNRAAGGQTIFATPTYTTLTMGNTSGTQTAGGNITTTTLNNNTAGIILNMSTFTLAATTITNNATATIRTQNTSATPIPTGLTIGGIVTYDVASGAQTVRGNTYNTLTMGNTSGTQTAGGNITTTTLNNNTAGIILDMATFTLAATTITNTATATIRTQNTSATPLPTSITIGGTVNYNAASGGQTIRANTYTNLTMGNTSGAQTAAGNLVVNGTLTTTAGGILDLVTFTLSGTLGTITNNGTIATQSITAAIPTGRAWGGTINYNRLIGGQSLVSATSYNNLTLGNTSGVQTVAANLVVNGTLTTTAGGTLNMVTFTLTVATVAHSGILNTQNTSVAPVTTGKTWGGTVNYNSASAQTIVNGNYTNLNGTGGARTLSNTGTVGVSGTFTPGVGAYTVTSSTVNYNNLTGGQTIANLAYNNVTIGNTSGVQTASGNLVVNGTLTTTAGGTLDLATFTLSGTLGTITNNGTITTINTSATPIPSGKTWGGTIKYELATGAQTLVGGTFNTIIVSASLGNQNAMGGNITANTNFQYSNTGKVAIGSNTLTLNGTLTGHTATANFIANGSSNIVIGGSGALGGSLFLDQTTPGTSNRLANLTYNRSSQTITLGNAMQVTGTVTPTLGTLATGGFLTLVSNATGTARIADGGCTTCSYISGNVHVQRNIPATARRWRFMGSPVTTSTLADWQAETYITGAGGAANGFDATLSNQASVYSYNEGSTTGDINTGWVAASNITNTLDVGKGYRLFIRGDRSDTGRLTGTVTTQNEVTLDLVGVPNQGDIVMPVTFNSSGTPANDGWNLVSNPYASPYDWNAHYDNGSFHTNIDPTIQILSAVTGSYDSYTATGNTGSLTGGIIPPGASFWVKATAGSPSLTFKEQFKVGTTPVGVFKTNENESFSIQLYLDSSTSDKVFVKYMSAATANYDNYDIVKLGAAVSISAYGNDNIMLAASVRPIVNNAADTVKLKVTAAAGNYKLKFANSNQIAVQENVFLIDSYLSTVTDLKETNEYSFSIVSGVSASQGLNRFYILVANNNSLPLNLLAFGARDIGLTMYPIPAKDVLTISHVSHITNLHVYDVTGKEVYTANELSSTATIDVQPLVQGIYFIELTDETGTTYKDKFVKE